MRYLIISAADLDSLAYEVSSYVKEGWQPSGGPIGWCGKLSQAIYLPPLTSPVTVVAPNQQEMAV